MNVSYVRYQIHFSHRSNRSPRWPPIRVRLDYLQLSTCPHSELFLARRCSHIPRFGDMDRVFMAWSTALLQILSFHIPKSETFNLVTSLVGVSPNASEVLSIRYDRWTVPGFWAVGCTVSEESLSAPGHEMGIGYQPKNRFYKRKAAKGDPNQWFQDCKEEQKSPFVGDISCACTLVPYDTQECNDANTAHRDMLSELATNN